MEHIRTNKVKKFASWQTSDLEADVTIAGWWMSFRQVG